VGSSYLFPSDLVGNTANQWFLVGTPSYAALPGAVAPDYVLTSDNFFNINGDTLEINGDIGLCCSITYGSGALPTDGFNSLVPGSGVQLNSPTNFAGQSGSIPEPATIAILACGSVMLLGRRRRCDVTRSG
jgi:hypothetical protein